MMSILNSEKPVVKVENLTKSFKIPLESSSGLKQKLINIIKGRKGYRVFAPLNDISFDIYEGEFFGIVGRNGSGKSTLLKTIAGIYAPNRGSVHVAGTLVPFIELGVGFNPELSGRENVYLNGALLGFSHEEMRIMYDDIVGFAELHDFMDERLKNYSSGMQVRLAFSIAIRAKGDILLLDEVLAVGDEAFQRKCFDYFEQIRAKKQTVILVTHDMRTVEQYCTRALILRDGNIEKIGKPADIAAEYTQENQEQIQKQGHIRHAKYEKTNVSFDFYNQEDLTTSFNVSDRMRLVVSWQREDVENVGISIHKQSGERMFSTNTFETNLQAKIKQAKKITYEVDLNLAPGTYYIRARLLGDSPHKTLELVNDGPLFDIFSPDRSARVEGLVRLPHEWK